MPSFGVDKWKNRTIDFGTCYEVYTKPGFQSVCICRDAKTAKKIAELLEAKGET